MKFLRTLNKFLLLFISTAIISLIVLNISLQKKDLDNNNKNSLVEKRKLFEYDVLKNFCLKGPSNLVYKYYPEENKKNIDIEDSSNEDREPNSFSKGIYDLINNKKLDTSFLTNYLTKRILIFAICLVLSFFSIIGWFVYCCCCCCPCCCCKPKKPDCCCKVFSFTVFILLFAGGVIVSFLETTKVSKLVEGSYGLSCSFMQFLNTISVGEANADEKKANGEPAWVGISNINDMVDDIKDQINNIVGQMDFLNNDSKELEKLDKEFEYTINNITKDLENMKLNYTDNGNLIIYDVIYKHSYGDENEGFIKEINENYDSLINLAKNAYDTGLDYTSNIDDKSKDITDTLDKIIGDVLDEFRKMIDDFETDIIKSLNKYIEDYVDGYGSKYLKIFMFSLGGIISLLIILVLLFIFLGKCCCFFSSKCYKAIIHFWWNLITLIMCICFLIGSVIGIIGCLGQDLVGVVNYILSPEILSAGEFKMLSKDIGEKLDVCVNGDGDLSGLFDMSETTKSISNLLDQLSVISEEKEELQNSTFDFAAFLTEKIENISVFVLVGYNYTSEDRDEGFFNYYTKISAKVKTQCNVLWVYDNSQCINGYTYYKNDGNNPITGISGKCISILEWDNFYESCDNLTLEELSSLESVREGNKEHLATIEKINNEIQNNFAAVKDQLLESLVKVENISSSISAIFGETKNTSKIFSDMINCLFIKDNLFELLGQLRQGLGNNFRNFGLVLCIVSLCVGGGLIFLIPILNKFHFKNPKAKEKMAKDREKKENNDNKNENENKNEKEKEKEKENNVVAYNQNK